MRTRQNSTRELRSRRRRRAAVVAVVAGIVSALFLAGPASTSPAERDYPCPEGTFGEEPAPGSDPSCFCDTDDPEWSGVAIIDVYGETVADLEACQAAALAVPYDPACHAAANPPMTPDGDYFEGPVPSCAPGQDGPVVSSGSATADGAPAPMAPPASSTGEAGPVAGRPSVTG